MTNYMIIPGIMTIDDAVSQVWGIYKERMLRKENSRAVSEPRMVAMWWQYYHTDVSKAQISGKYGLEHGASHHALKTVNNLMNCNKEFNEKVTRVMLIMDHVKGLKPTK